MEFVVPTVPAGELPSTFHGTPARTTQYSHSIRRHPKRHYQECQKHSLRGAVIVRCDRALGWNACGDAAARYKKFATTASHQFFRRRACFQPKTAAHCAVAVPGGRTREQTREQTRERTRKQSDQQKCSRARGPRFLAKPRPNSKPEKMLR